METCARCKVKIADFKCEDCCQLFCVGCDSYLHSLPNNIGHKRIFLHFPSEQNTNFNTLNTTDFTNNDNLLNNNIINQNYEKVCPQNDMSKNIVIQLREMYEREKNDLKRQIKQLTDELNFTKNLEHNKVEVNNINSTMNDIMNNNENKYSNEKKFQNYSYEINSENYIEDSNMIEKLNTIICDKETQIEYLIEEINKEKELNCQLNKKIRNYENCVCLTKQQYINEIEHLNCLLENLCNEKNAMENCYKQKIEEINQMYECEKEKIICCYNLKISDLNEDKNKFVQLIKEKDELFRKYEENANKEKNDLNTIIDNLKEINSNTEKDKNDLIKMNDSLKKTIEEVNNSLENTKVNNKDLVSENEKLIEINNKIIEENNEIKKANEQLQGLVYGRFVKK